MGPMTSCGKKEWEREWRHCGDLRFAIEDVVAALIPEVDHIDFRNDYRSRLGTARTSSAEALKLLDGQ